MKKFLYVAFLFLVILTGYEIMDTYGLFESKNTKNIIPEIGKWYITLNNIDITQERVINASDLLYESNINIEEGYFAPGSTASYEIIIDPKNTDVAIRYDITVDMSEIINHPNIVFDASSDVVNDTVEDGSVFSGVIPLASILAEEKTTILTSLIWNNDENLNQYDNMLGDGSRTLSIKIKIKFSQYLGEEL